MKEEKTTTEETIAELNIRMADKIQEALLQERQRMVEKIRNRLDSPLWSENEATMDCAALVEKVLLSLLTDKEELKDNGGN